MKKLSGLIIILTICASCNTSDTSDRAQDDRMGWWEDARFGMFIHWGLYAVPAGEWEETNNHAEWIRTTAEIPLQTYNGFVDEFNPIKFNAGEWVSIAADAGMKYIVITSKHHDGFCLFDSEYTDFDIMSTPFERDILKELSDACAEQGIEMCWYHSIMDWHHPDYLPRRNWEKERSVEGAEFDRYIEYMKNQLAELTNNYGRIGVLWFDGEWEDTWTHEMGIDLYDYVLGLQDGIIVNNRVDKGRRGMQGMTESDEFKGDFGTPEQEIPATGLPDVKWETCMTMNNHWGYNKYDDNWKSEEDLIQKLVDIASKGGNFLLNVGPKADGTFPQESIDRLKAIGDWMDIYGESIYGSSASPFKNLSWGRCTKEEIAGGTRLYLHVFDWPENNRLVLSGLHNEIKEAWLMDGMKNLEYSLADGDVIFDLPSQAPDDYCSVVIVDIKGLPEIIEAPLILPSESDFVKTSLVIIYDNIPDDLEVRYTIDGTDPDIKSKKYISEFQIDKTTTIKAAIFSKGKQLCAVSEKIFNKVEPEPSAEAEIKGSGLKYSYYEGDWDAMPEFSALTALGTGVISEPLIIEEAKDEYFGICFEAYINIPEDGMYSFSLKSDDGSLLFINDVLLIDNDKTHSAVELNAGIALARGFHSLKLEYFQKTGGKELELLLSGPGIGNKQNIGEYLSY